MSETNTLSPEEVAALRKLKMYIFVTNDIPLGHAVNSVAHASLACYLRYDTDTVMNDWVACSFKKVTCEVSRQELEKLALREERHVKITESALDNKLTAVAFCPIREWPREFLDYNLFA